MRKIILVLAAATFVVMLPFRGYSLGLGEIETYSALNQELEAEIEVLSATPDDADTMIIKLASREQFSSAGLDRPFFLKNLKFTTVVKNGTPYIRVVTTKPVREPFLDFLLEIDWPQGRLLREFTILLDPPVFTGQAERSGRPAATEDAGQPTPVAVQPIEDSFRPAAAAVMGSPAPAASGLLESPVVAPYVEPIVAHVPTDAVVSHTQSKMSGERYRIQSGDTLWSLASDMQAGSNASVEQIMLALLRENPEAFINENINGIKRGYVLRIPGREDLASLDSSSALAEVREQNALWREYSQALAGAEPASALESAAMSGEEGDFESGLDSETELKIMSAAEGEGGAATAGKDPAAKRIFALKNELAAAYEAMETEKLENDELQGRVSELQQQVEQMKRLLSLEDSEMAALQVTSADEAPMAEEQGVDEESTGMAPGETPMETTMGDESIDAMSEESLPGEEPASEEGMSDEAMVGEDEPAMAEEVMGDAAEGESPFVDEAAVPELEPESPMIVQEPMIDETIPPFARTRSSNPFAALLNDPALLGALAAALLAVAGLVVLIIRRRRASDDEVTPTMAMDEDLDVDEIADDLDQFAEELSEPAGVNDEPALEEASSGIVINEHVREEKTDDFNADDTLVLTSPEDTVISLSDTPEDEGPRDDVIAESDVYLAYGIYAQAEELLRGAIEQNPDRDDYRMKLAETYYAAKNADDFVALAKEMLTRFGGENNDMWKKMVAMGSELSPENEMFRAAGTMPDFDPDELIPKKPESPDLELDAGDDQASDFDLTLEDAVDDGGVEFEISEIDDKAKAAENDEDEEFLLDIEASELGLETPQESANESDDLELDMDLDLGGGVDAPEVDVNSSASEEDISLEDMAAVLDMDLDAGASGLDELSLEDTDATDGDEFDVSDLPDDVDEMNTKLDLARAYIDMGDSEGGKSILEEVIADGGEEHKKQANELLQKIG